MIRSLFGSSRHHYRPIGNPLNATYENLNKEKNQNRHTQSHFNSSNEVYLPLQQLLNSTLSISISHLHIAYS